MTAVFKMDDGAEMRFTRSVQGTAAEHRINGEVSVFRYIGRFLLAIGIGDSWKVARSRFTACQRTRIFGPFGAVGNKRESEEFPRFSGSGRVDRDEKSEREDCVV